jgi:hypothetical protein
MEPAIPPGVSPDIAFLARQQAQQHYDRRVDSRATEEAIASSAQATHARFDRVDVELRDKPGRAEVRAIMAFGGAVLLLLLFAVLQLVGVDTSAAVRDTRELIDLAPEWPVAAPADVSATAPPDVGANAEPAPQGNGGAPLP